MTAQAAAGKRGQRDGRFLRARSRSWSSLPSGPPRTCSASTYSGGCPRLGLPCRRPRLMPWEVRLGESSSVELAGTNSCRMRRRIRSPNPAAVSGSTARNATSSAGPVGGLRRARRAPVVRPPHAGLCGSRRGPGCRRGEGWLRHDKGPYPVPGAARRCRGRGRGGSRRRSADAAEPCDDAQAVVTVGRVPGGRRACSPGLGGHCCWHRWRSLRHTSWRGCRWTAPPWAPQGWMALRDSALVVGGAWTRCQDDQLARTAHPSASCGLPSRIVMPHPA